MFRISMGLLTLLLLPLAHPLRIEAAEGSGAAEILQEEQSRQSENERGNMMWNAYAWAIGGTLVPITAAMVMGNLRNDNGPLAGTLVGSGVLLGPSLGQFYTGSLGQGFAGLGIRTLGGLMSVAGFALILGDAFCGFDDPEREKHCDDEGGGGGTLLILGLATYAGGVVYSMVDTHASVERHFIRREDRFGLAPVLIPQGKGPLKTGAMAWMRF